LDLWNVEWEMPFGDDRIFETPETASGAK
jgi:hypothetical protein